MSPLKNLTAADTQIQKDHDALQIASIPAMESKLKRIFKVRYSLI